MMDQVITLVNDGDPAAALIAIDFIEEDDFFVFGRTLKKEAARALRRRAVLDDEQKLRIRRRIVGMMLAGNVPYEFSEYKRLLRAVGVGELWPLLQASVDRGNRYVMWHYRYLLLHTLPNDFNPCCSADRDTARRFPVGGWQRVAPDT